VIPYSLVRDYQRLEEHTTSVFRAEVTEKSLPWKSENVALFRVKNALPSLCFIQNQEHMKMPAQYRR